MPGLFADFLTFAPLSVRTPRYTRPVIVFRLSLMGSTFTLVWFVLVQILLYSSSSTCRRSSPHLWWLTFGVLCVMYVMILEVVVVAILVFVVGPILFVRYNNFCVPWLRLTRAVILEHPSSLSRKTPIPKPASFYT